MPERVAGRSRAPRAALAALCLAAAFTAAQARGVRATFLAVGASGEREQVTLSDVRYGYVVRRLLDRRTPKAAPGAGPAPLPYRDRTIRKRALVLQNERIPLHMIRSIEVGYRPSSTPGTQVLALRITLETGTERDVPGIDLRGFEGIEPPFLEGMDGDTPRRFALAPFRAEASAAQGPALEKVLFHNRPRGGRARPRP